MDLRELRYFAAVAETKHVGRAAETLFISQPSLSHAIRQLERELGVTLFTRHSRGMEPTDAGRDLLPYARRTLRAADQFAEVARSHATGDAGRLRLGFQASGAGTLGPRIRARFAELRPGVELELKRYNWGSEVPALRAGEVDAAYVWQPNDLTGLASLRLAEEQRVIALPVDHPLAGEPELTLGQIRDVPLAWTRQAPREWVRWWAVDPRPDGSEVRWGAENHNAEEMLENVASGQGASIAPESMAAFYARPDIVWVRLADTEPLRIDLAWDPASSGPVVDAFVASARDVVAGRA
ncbi:LysR family transcriptional regulator [Streptodolium elevatio]|uniref:LysR family transcriptional regulator n=1 Tax=Streptodolium elevatio TaxID=3157996 RepID=A0ABV3DXG1_9ACTN